MSDITYGAKYKQGMTGPEISKAIRNDIKAAKAAGELPEGLKVSVRFSWATHSKAINVKVTAAPFQVLNRERLALDLGDPNTFHADSHYPIFTEQAKEILKKLQAIMDQYNFDGSDLMTDYFHVNFYGRAEYDWTLRRAEEEAVSWRKLQRNDGDFNIYDGSTDVALCVRPKNADLIIAAPDGYKLAQLIIHGDGFSPNHMQKVIDAARALLAKVEGK